MNITYTAAPSGHEPALESSMDMGFTAERFPVGTHMCYVYSDEAERREIMARYMNAGLLAHEFVGYFADIDNPEVVDDYLREMGIQIPDTQEPQHVFFQRARDVYCPGGHFTPAGMLGRLRALHQECHAHGIQHIRVTGEMSWALSEEIDGTDQLVEYESRLNLLEETHPLTAICQYDARKFDGGTLFEILQVHPLMVVRGQIVRNPYYIPVRDYLSRHGLSLEE